MKKILIIILFVFNYIQDASAQNTINTVPEINLQFQELDTNFIYLGYKNRKRYFLSKDRFTWSEADRNSKSYPNLQLAVITDTATNKFIADSVLKYISQVQGNTNENIVHIGAKYFKKYNDFRNIDLSPLKFSKWRSGHPVKSIALENMQLGIMMFAGNDVNNVYAEWIEAGDLSGWWYVAEQRAFNDDLIPIVYDAYSMFANNTISKCDSIPARVNFLNQSVNGVNYIWNFGDSSQTSSDTNPTHYYNKFGNYKVSLIVKNNFSSDTSFNNIVIGGCPLEYQSFKSNKEYLYPWKGRNIVMLSQKNNLDTAIMNKWVRSLDNAYDYYKNITGKVPNIISDKYYFNLRTIAQVNSTCGAGCGYIGSSGIEYLRSFFDVDYLRTVSYTHLTLPTILRV